MAFCDSLLWNLLFQTITESTKQNGKSFEETETLAAKALLRDDGLGDSWKLTPLSASWSFWKDLTKPHNKVGMKTQDFAKHLEETGHFTSIDALDKIWQARTKNLRMFSNLRIFRDPIKPLWEVPQNKNGGKFVIILGKKEHGDAFGQEEDKNATISQTSSVSAHGSQTSHHIDEVDSISSHDTSQPSHSVKSASNTEKVSTEVPVDFKLILALMVLGFLGPVSEFCGCVLSIRAFGNMISIWTSSSENEIVNKIRERIAFFLNVPLDHITFQKHNESIRNNTRNLTKTETRKRMREARSKGESSETPQSNQPHQSHLDLRRKSDPLSKPNWVIERSPLNQNEQVDHQTIETKLPEKPSGTTVIRSRSHGKIEVAIPDASDRFEGHYRSKSNMNEKLSPRGGPKSPRGSSSSDHHMNTNPTSPRSKNLSYASVVATSSIPTSPRSNQLSTSSNQSSHQQHQKSNQESSSHQHQHQKSNQESSSHQHQHQKSNQESSHQHQKSNQTSSILNDQSKSRNRSKPRALSTGKADRVSFQDKVSVQAVHLNEPPIHIASHAQYVQLSSSPVPQILIGTPPTSSLSSMPRSSQNAVNNSNNNNNNHKPVSFLSSQDDSITVSSHAENSMASSSSSSSSSSKPSFQAKKRRAQSASASDQPKPMVGYVSPEALFGADLPLLSPSGTPYPSVPPSPPAELDEEDYQFLANEKSEHNVKQTLAAKIEALSLENSQTSKSELSPRDGSTSARKRRNRKKKSLTQDSGDNVSSDHQQSPRSSSGAAQEPIPSQSLDPQVTTNRQQGAVPNQNSNTTDADGNAASPAIAAVVVGITSVVGLAIYHAAGI